MATIKRLVSDTLWYGLSSMVGRAINILLFPIITAALSVAEFGSYSYLYSFVAVCFVFYTIRLETAYFRFDEKQSKYTHYSQAFISVLLLSLTFSGCLFIFARPIALVIGTPLSQVILIKMLALILFFDALNEIPFAKLRLENRPRKFALIKIGMILVNVFLVLSIFVFIPWLINQGHTGLSRIYHPDHHLAYLFAANVISSLFAFVLLIPEWRAVHWTIHTTELKKMWRYSIPLMFVGLAGIINETTDRIFLRKLLPYDTDTIYETIGIYSGNYKIAMFIALFTQAFRYAAEPFFFQQKDKVDANILYGKITTYYIVFTSFGFLAVGLSLPWLQGFMLDKPEYQSGYWVTPIILMANVFLGIYYNLSIWYKLTDKTKYGMYLAFFGAFITIFGNLIFIPILGYMASAWTTLICYLSMTILSYWIGKIHYPLHLEFSKITRCFFIPLICYTLYEVGWHNQPWDQGLAQWMRVVFFLLPFSYYLYWDRKQIKDILSGRL